MEWFCGILLMMMMKLECRIPTPGKSSDVQSRPEQFNMQRTGGEMSLKAETNTLEVGELVVVVVVVD